MPMTPDEISKLPYRRCAGVMLVNGDGAVFVGQRRDSDNAAWQMPQGGIDAGESPRTAALRELREETGVPPRLVRVEAETREWVPYDLPQDLVPRLWHGQYRGQEQKWFLLRFLGTDDDVNIETDTPEFSAWKWLPPDQVVSHIVPFKRDVYARVLQEFREYLR